MFYVWQTSNEALKQKSGENYRHKFEDLATSQISNQRRRHPGQQTEVQTDQLCDPGQ